MISSKLHGITLPNLNAKRMIYNRAWKQNVNIKRNCWRNKHNLLT